MKSVLVTGAAGYVGTAVVEHLVGLGLEVTGLDLTKPDHRVRWIRADLADKAVLDSAVKGKRFDVIMHVASLPGDTGDPYQMMQTNVWGTLNLLEVARLMGVHRFALVSSISAYEWYPATKFNAPDHLPVDENHHCRPKDMYSTTKRVQELLATTYYWQYGVPTTAIRLAAVVGAHAKGGGRGWRVFAEQMAEGKRVEIPHFTAEELCHYVDVRDVARMLVAVSERDSAIGEVFNCCGPRACRGYEIAQWVQELVPGIEAVYGFPWSMAQGGEIEFSMAKAERLIGFEPKYTMKDSIGYIKEWIDSGGLDENVTAGESYVGGMPSEDK